MLVVVLKREKIVDFKYFSRKRLGYYFYILKNKIRLREVQVVDG